MKREYSYNDNIICFGKKEVLLNEKIAEIVEFEKCVIVREKYSIKNPTNNVVAVDFSGNIIWKVDDAIKPLEPQTIVSIGKKDCQYISLITFSGLNLVIDSVSGRVVEKKITK